MWLNPGGMKGEAQQEQVHWEKNRVLTDEKKY